MLAIRYIKSIPAKSAMIPAKTPTVLEEALQIVINFLTKIEARAIHAEAKAKTMEQTETKNTMTTKEEGRKKEQGQMSMKKPIASTYAQTVQEATTTVIMKAKEDRIARGSRKPR